MKVKLLIYIITFGVSISALFICLYIPITILRYGSLRFSEPSEFVLIIEIIWGLIGIIILPFIAIDIIKKEIEKNATF